MIKPGVPENEQKRIQALIELGILDSKAEERFDRITRLTANHFGAKTCLISLVDVDRQWFKSKVGLNVCETDRDISFCGHAILQDDIMIVPDARLDERFIDNPLVTGEPQIIFYAGVPLFTTDGYKVGTLCIFDDKPRTLSPLQIAMLRDCANMVEEALNDLSRKQLHFERHETSVRTHRMLDVFPDIVFIFDKNFRYIEANDHRDLYVPRDQFIGKKIADVLPEPIARLFEDSLKQAFETGELVTFDYEIELHGIPSFFEARARQISEKEVLVVVRNITDERDRMIELERLSMVAEQTTNSVIITDTQRNVLWVNNSFTKITGYTLEEMVGKNPGKILQGPDTNPETIETMREALNQQKSFTVDVINYNKYHEQYWVRIICNPWLSESGELKGFIAIQTDITQEIENLEAIRYNQKMLAAVIDANEIGTWILNLQTRTLEINETWARLLGYTLQELEPIDMDTWQNLTHPEDLQACLRMFEDYDKGIIDYYEAPIRMKHKAGHWLWIRTRGSITTRTADGRAEFTLGTHLNIHAQKLAEAHLQEQYEYMQLIFDNMIDGIVIFDEQGKVQSFNPASEHIFGFKSDEILNQDISLIIPELCRTGTEDELRYAQGKRRTGSLFPLEMGVVQSQHQQETIYVCMLRDITERKNAEQAIEKLAYFDSLSGLPNRQLLFDRLRQTLLSSVRTENNVAILFIDFDNFKQINDSAGHEVGDILLQKISARLQSMVRANDTVARLGGDEFVVILDGLEGNQDNIQHLVEKVANKIKAEINKTYDLGKLSYTGSCCIGITVCDDPSLPASEYLKRADLAMYQAKLAGKDAIRFFETDMQDHVTSRIEMEQALRSALDNNEFEVFYQSQFDDNGRCIGAECLLRWRHPQKGLVSPFDFIPVAEESGLIVPIGRWVLKQACERLRDWASHPDLSQVVLAINISVKELSQDDWVESVLQTIEITGINPNKLKLEVTESVMAYDIAKVVAKLTRLRQCGLTISLDDFGTGYSSLTYLRTLPLDQLKIDKSFIRDILVDRHEKVIAETIINLGKVMGLDVIAEGVETEEQLNMLKAIGCKNFQGYYFSKPLPIEDFENYTKYSQPH